MDRKRVLFVDDEPMVLQGLQRMLRPMRETWDMVFAEGGHKALEMMSEQPADVVVSDMRMPVMNGAELLTEIMKRWPATVRLVLSGHADRELVAKCVGVAHQYISKPCDPEQLKSMIQNAVLLSHHLVSEDVKRIIGSIDQLPSIPKVYLDLREALKREDVTLLEIGEIVQRDIGMTAKILKLVNSAFFGLRRTITSPQEAVSYLGLETIQVLVLANGIFEQTKIFETRLFNVDHLWHHSLSVATGAKALANFEKLGKTLADEAFVGGLLHDVGVLVLAANFPAQYDNLAKVVLEEKISIPMAELEEFGVTHAEVGAYLLGLWGLPASLLKIISLHHRPSVAADKQFSPLLAVHVADALSGRHGSHPLFEPTKLDHAALAEAGVEDRLGLWEEVLTQPQET